MKLVRIISYFLFLAVIAGAFASMAQNNYGLALISVSCFLFSLLFVVTLINSKKGLLLNKIEVAGLATLSLLFGLRSSYIHIPYIEWVLIASCIALIGVYSMRVWNNRSMERASAFFWFLLAFYAGLIFLLGSMAIRIFSPMFSQLLGGAGFGLLTLFAAGQIWLGWTLVDGAKTTLLKFVRIQSPYSMILATGFVMISMYAGLDLIKLAPPLYTDKVPPTYLELVRKAESGEEKPVNGTFEHDRYKDAYDAFVQKNR